MAIERLLGTDTLKDMYPKVNKLIDEYDAQVINAGDSNAEIVDARGGVSVLRKKV